MPILLVLILASLEFGMVQVYPTRREVAFTAYLMNKAHSILNNVNNNLRNQELIDPFSPTFANSMDFGGK